MGVFATPSELICRDCSHELTPTEAEHGRCSCGCAALLTREAIENAKKKIAAILAADGHEGHA